MLRVCMTWGGDKVQRANFEWNAKAWCITLGDDDTAQVNLSVMLWVFMMWGSDTVQQVILR